MYSEKSLLDAFYSLELEALSKLNATLSEIIKEVNESLGRILKFTVEKAEYLEEALKTDITTTRQYLSQNVSSSVSIEEFKSSNQVNIDSFSLSRGIQNKVTESQYVNQHVTSSSNNQFSLINNMENDYSHPRKNNEVSL